MPSLVRRHLCEIPRCPDDGEVPHVPSRLLPDPRRPKFVFASCANPLLDSRSPRRPPTLLADPSPATRHHLSPRRDAGQAAAGRRRRSLGPHTWACGARPTPRAPHAPRTRSARAGPPARSRHPPAARTAPSPLSRRAPGPRLHGKGPVAPQSSDLLPREGRMASALGGATRARRALSPRRPDRGRPHLGASPSRGGGRRLTGGASSSNHAPCGPHVPARSASRADPLVPAAPPGSEPRPRRRPPRAGASRRLGVELAPALSDREGPSPSRARRGPRPRATARPAAARPPRARPRDREPSLVRSDEGRPVPPPRLAARGARGADRALFVLRPRDRRR